jgi:anthranilate phosphoribosyltransferase
MTDATPDEHPFAPFVRTLGRGKKGARPLTQDEAYQAMAMILNGEVEDTQLGAFLMLLRVKEETSEELAGFVAAARDSIALPTGHEAILLDWPTYAGKRRQLPWYVLSALLLSTHDIPVLMHGTRGTKLDRIYSIDALEALGLFASPSLDAAVNTIASQGFAYVDLDTVCPKLKQILDLRRLFGLRSPINTLLRMLNPGRAPYVFQSTFHPGYRQIHQKAGQLLHQPHQAVFKGEGGEIEWTPDKDCQVFSLHNGIISEETWPTLAGRRFLKDSSMDVTRLPDLWRGEIEDDYGEAAIIGTTAIALRLLERAASVADALAQAEEMWQKRDKKKY